MRPLSGVRVLEIGQVLSAPYSGSIFADLGAEVVKVERPEGGDDARQMGPAFRGGDSLNFHIFNRGKKSVAINLKSARGRDDLERLIAESDILVHNLRPGIAAEIGIDGPSVCGRHPRLLYCEISAFGHAGPMAMLPGYEPMVQAFSGLSSTNGGPDDPPIRIGASVCDLGTGMWCVIGLLALLHRRTETGVGGMLNASLLETALAWNVQKLDSYRNVGTIPARHASGHPSFVPYEAFETLDGPLLICCGNDRLFGKLAEVLGQPAWSEDARYVTNRQRIANKGQLIPALNALLRVRPRNEWVARLREAGVPCAPILGIEEIVREDQVAALGIFQPVPDDNFELTSMPLTFDGERLGPVGPAPALGAHNARYHLAELAAELTTDLATELATERKA